MILVKVDVTPGRWSLEQAQKLRNWNIHLAVSGLVETNWKVSTIVSEITISVPFLCRCLDFLDGLSSLFGRAVNY